MRGLREGSSEVALDPRLERQDGVVTLAAAAPSALARWASTPRKVLSCPPPPQTSPSRRAGSGYSPSGALVDLATVRATSVWGRSGAVRLHVLDYGPADAVPLVVVPGITSPAVTTDIVARELTDLVRPLVLDVRGRGLSDDVPGTGPLHGYDLGAYAAGVDSVIEQLQLRAPTLLGRSMGARIAAQAAVSGGSRVAATVPVDPPMSDPDRPNPTSLATFLAQIDQARRVGNRRRRGGRIVAPMAPPGARAACRLAGLLFPYRHRRDVRGLRIRGTPSALGEAHPARRPAVRFGMPGADVGGRRDIASANPVHPLVASKAPGKWSSGTSPGRQRR